MTATMLCTDFDKNFSPRLDGGDGNGLAKQCNLGKDPRELGSSSRADTQ